MEQQVIRTQRIELFDDTGKVTMTLDATKGLQLWGKDSTPKAGLLLLNTGQPALMFFHGPVWFCRKLLMRASATITFCCLCSQRVELLRGSLGVGFGSCQLSLVNGMHDFYAGDGTPRRPKGFETQHRTREPFHGSVVLLDEIIEIFGVANNNGGLMRRVVVFDRRGVAATLIDGDFLRESLAANGFA